MQNYESAALRHFFDATSLLKRGDLDNAGHLIGFAAECAIKFRIVSLRPSQDSPHGHFPEIVNVARKHLSGGRFSYTSMFDLLKTDVLRGWTVNRRYQETGSTTFDEVNEWFIDTKRIFASANLKARKE